MESAPPAAAKAAVAGAHHAAAADHHRPAAHPPHTTHTTHTSRNSHAGHTGHRSTARAAHPARVLVLSPTRELALQIAESFETYGANTRLSQTVIFGGVGQGQQVAALKRGVDIIVATPGRLLDLMEQGYVNLTGIEIFVLDEADRMLDMGFIADIRKIVAKLPHKRQTLMFSATMPRDIRQLADTILRSPVSVEVTPVSSTTELVQQAVYMVDKQHKPELLAHILKSKAARSRTLVFTRTKHGADKLVKSLMKDGIGADAIHGNKRQNIRQKTLESFRTGRTPVLVATDIAARGIDIDEIELVVNFDIPNIPETYVHRIGRTGRAGATGRAIAFCDRDERFFLRDIEKLIRRSIPVLDDAPKFAARPAERESRGERAHAGHRGQPHRTGGSGPAKRPARVGGGAGKRQGAHSAARTSAGKPAAAGDHALREAKPAARSSHAGHSGHASHPGHAGHSGHSGHTGGGHAGHSAHPAHKPASGSSSRRNFRGGTIKP
ncbi:MAG: DEAD/DEAH box helicase [Phycisphaerales bacterium]|nr:DEAD/DEAH box helicase [Phycisphaerales bacterium]